MKKAWKTVCEFSKGSEIQKEEMRGWNELGIVDTIYEEEHEHEDSSSSLSLSSFPTTPFQQSRQDSWSVPTGRETNVLINVQDSCFHLHKDTLSSRSGFLKRQLIELSEITLSPPLNITAETFTLVADFCYGTDLVITPFNVAALRTAAELLEMTEINGDDDGENLWQLTESYFRRVVAVNREYASIVFRSSLLLLPEAETTAFLVSRCVEALSLTEDGDGVMSCIDDVKTVRPEDFEVIAGSMHCRLTESHDLLYKIIDYYLKEHNGKITDDQKAQICNCIDCTMLSPQLLMHAVQNPKLPLRFIVQAMFVEQLKTRRSIYSAVDHKPRKQTQKDDITLGTILERDAAVRQATHLKAAMDVTSSRIQSLERELDDMKRLLNESENLRSVLESGRSASFRFSSENKIERGERGSASSASFRIVTRRENMLGAFLSEGSSNEESPRVEKGFGRKLMSGLKSVFRASKQKSENIYERKVDGEGERSGGKDGNGSFVVIKKDIPFHRRSHSQG